MEEYESFLWQFIDNFSTVEVVLPVNCSLDPDAITSWQLHFQYFFYYRKLQQGVDFFLLLLDYGLMDTVLKASISLSLITGWLI